MEITENGPHDVTQKTKGSGGGLYFFTPTYICINVKINTQAIGGTQIEAVSLDSIAAPMLLPSVADPT